MTGVITHGALREGGDPSGAIARFTLVDDDKTDVAGFAFSFWDVPIVPCAPVPTFLDLGQGAVMVQG